MDKDTMDYITRFNQKNATREAMENALFLEEQTRKIAILINKAYQIGEREGTEILGTVVASIIMVNSKNLDQAIIRTHKLHENIQKTLIEIDKDLVKQ